MLWIWLTDLACVWFSPEGAPGFWWTASKGLLFTLFAAPGVYWSVRREVREAGRSATLLHAVVEETTDAVFVKDGRGRYLLFNTAAARLVGKPVEAVLGNDDTALFDPPSARVVMDRDRRVVEAGVATTEEEVLSSGGVTRTYLATKAPYRCPDGTVGGIIGISRDISDRKEVERQLLAERDRFEMISQAAPIVICSFHLRADGTWCFSYASPRIEELFGLTAEQLAANATPVRQVIHPDDFGPVRDAVFASARGLTVLHAEFRVRHAVRGEIWVEGRATPAAQPDGSVVWHGYFGDVTERKRVEAEVHQARWMLRLVLDTVPQGVFWKNLQSRHIGCNAVVARALGFDSPDQVIGRADSDLPTVSPDQAAAFMRDDQEVMRSGSPRLRVSEQLTRADGSTVWLETNKLPLRDDAGRVIGVIGTWEDVTERRRAERTLQESEARFRLAREAGEIGFFDWDAETGRSVWTAEQEAIYGLPPGGFGGTHDDWVKRVHPGDRERVLAHIAGAVAGGQTVTVDEYRIVRPGGETRWVTNRGRLDYTENRQLRRVIGTTIDVTERALVLTALQAERDRFERIVEAVPVVICSFDLRTDGTACIRFASRKIEGIYGLSTEDLAADPALIFERLHPADAGPVRAAVAEAARASTPWRCSFRVLNPSRGEIWVEGQAAPVRQPGGSTTWHGFLADITEQKRTVDALQASEERAGRGEALLSAVMDSLPVSVVVADERGRLVFMNPASGTIWGPAPMSNDLADYVEYVGYWPESGRRIGPNEWPMARAVLNGETTVAVRVEAERFGDGARRHLELSAAPVVNENGVRLGGVVACQDVTDRVAAEAALRASEARVRATFEQAAVGIAHVGMDCRFLWVNERYAAITGYSREELVGGLTLHAITYPDDRQQDAEGISRLLAGEIASYSPEKRFVRKDGSVTWVQVTVSAPRDTDCPPDHLIGVAQDITDRKQAEGALRESEARFRLLVASTMDGIISNDADHRVVLFNPAAEHMFRLPAAEVLGGPVDRLLPFKHRPHHAAHIDAFGRTGITNRSMGALGTVNGVRGDGEEFPIEASISQTEVNGRKVYTAIVRDITVRLRAEADLRESEARFRTLVHSLPDAVFLNVEGRVAFCNPACVRLFGAAGAEDLIGKTPFDLLPPEYHDLIRGRIEAQLLVGEGVPGVEEEILRLDGGRVPVYVTALPITDQGIPAILVVLHDLTEQKRVQAQLRHQELMIREAGELALVGGWEFDPLTGQGSWTAETARIHGLLPSPDATVAGGLDFYSGQHRERIEAAVAAAIAQGTPYDLELQLTAADGGQKWVRTICRPIVENGRVVRVRGSIQDITDRKRAEAEIRELNAELEQRVRDRTAELEVVNRELESFSYSVSHDLRSPIRHITAFTSIVLDGCGSQLPSESRGHLEQVSKAARRMGQLVDDLLAFSRLGRQHLRRQPVVTRRLVEECLDELMPLVAARHIETRVGDLPPCDGDPGLLRQVWLNLLANAVKYSGKREAAVVEIGATPTPEGTVYFVKDNGAGFDMRYAHKLFGVFQRLHRAEEFEGTGIGLALVQRIIHRHGGRVWAEGEPGKGATFWFTVGRGD